MNFFEGPLIFDGGIGTELYQRGFYINRPFEELCETAFEEVKRVHKNYLEAGAMCLTTNTFQVARAHLKRFDIESKQKSLIQLAIQAAVQAKQEFDPGNFKNIKIGFSMGPLGDLLEPLGRIGLDEAQEEYRQQVLAADSVCDQFDFFHLETFSNIDELRAAIKGVRSVDATKPILAMMSIRSEQKSLLNLFATKIGQRSDIQAIGLNCSEGPSDIFKSLQTIRTLTSKPIVVRPNAGIPRNMNGRYFYMTSPDYLAKFCRRYFEAGANGVGGCCGTGPQHIEAISRAFQMVRAKLTVDRSGQLKKDSNGSLAVTEDIGTAINVAFLKDNKRPSLLERPLSTLAQDLIEASKGKSKIISIELLPPKSVELERFLSTLQKVKQAGIKYVNLPDGARASTRVGSLHIASYVQHLNCGITAIPHFTTRDRNLIALQSDLLGASLNGVHQVLIVTGDPPKLGTNKDATAVFDIDSVGLTYLTDCLNRRFSTTGEELKIPTQFAIGVASNPTAIHFDQELTRWKYKVENGADYAVTQPIFDVEAYKRWRDTLLKEDCYRPHLLGIWPLVSLRNAEFMANEVPGVHVPEWVLSEMEKAGDDKHEARKRGIEIAQKVMRELQNECEGYCISAPVGIVEVALQTAKL